MDTNNAWYVYMLRCADGSYYVGVAQDVDCRVAVHNADHGSAHTARRLTTELIYSEFCGPKSAARSRENEIKGWGREKKEALIRGE
jgi:predicted GIY-YIG superfamily endonuclease